MSETKTPAGRAPAVYSKAQILRAARRTPHERDVLSAVLVDHQYYTQVQVQHLLSEFRKRKVT